MSSICICKTLQSTYLSCSIFQGYLFQILVVGFFASNPETHHATKFQEEDTKFLKSLINLNSTLLWTALIFNPLIKCSGTKVLSTHLNFQPTIIGSTYYCSWDLCPGKTGGQLQMNWLSLRNKQLKLETLGKLHINLEESVEYTSNE